MVLLIHHQRNSEVLLSVAVMFCLIKLFLSETLSFLLITVWLSIISFQMLNSFTYPNVVSIMYYDIVKNFS